MNNQAFHVMKKPQKKSQIMLSNDYLIPICVLFLSLSCLRDNTKRPWKKRNKFLLRPSRCDVKNVFWLSVWNEESDTSAECHFYWDLKKNNNIFQQNSNFIIGFSVNESVKGAHAAQTIRVVGCLECRPSSVGSNYLLCALEGVVRCFRFVAVQLETFLNVVLQCTHHL